MLWDLHRAIDRAIDTTAFVDACERLIADSPHVTVDIEAAGAFVPLVKAAKPTSWDWYLRDPEGPLKDRIYDILFSSAMNGGYFESVKDGHVRQWAMNGSGSEALLHWIDRLREARLLPGVDHVSLGEGIDDHGYRQEIDDFLAGVPYVEERRGVIEEFARVGELYYAQLTLERALTEVDGKLVGRFDWSHVNLLASLFPKGFGGDPFRKKACLAILLLTSHLVAHGHDVSADIPVPSDYQIPRILHWGKVIGLSPRVESAIHSGRLLDVTSEPVSHFRAAAIVVSHKLGQMGGRPDWIVDGALFMGVRKLTRFVEEAMPPMKIHGIWF